MRRLEAFGDYVYDPSVAQENLWGAFKGVDAEAMFGLMKQTKAYLAQSPEERDTDAFVLEVKEKVKRSSRTEVGVLVHRQALILINAYATNREVWDARINEWEAGKIKPTQPWEQF